MYPGNSQDIQAINQAVREHDGEYSLATIDQPISRDLTGQGIAELGFESNSRRSLTLIFTDGADVYGLVSELLINSAPETPDTLARVSLVRLPYGNFRLTSDGLINQGPHVIDTVVYGSHNFNEELHQNYIANAQISISETGSLMIRPTDHGSIVTLDINTFYKLTQEQHHTASKILLADLDQHPEYWLPN